MSFARTLLLCSALLSEDEKSTMIVDKKPSYPKTSLIASGVSYHFDRRTYNTKEGRRSFNEFNLGLGVEYRLSPNLHASSGFYENSMNNTSIYAAIGAETPGSLWFGIGADAGVISGYGRNIKPAVVPYARVGRRRDVLNLRINIIPAKPFVVAASVRVNLGKVE